MAAKPFDDDPAGSPGDEGSVIARFAFLGHDCVVVPSKTSPACGRTRLGSLVFAGQRYALDGAPQAPPGPDPVSRLTPRELEIALLIATGCCTKAISRKLGISAHTVGAHICRIFAKLDVHKRAELIARIAHRLVAAQAASPDGYQAVACFSAMAAFSMCSIA
jgi:DNA-binding CsgD family transcriptional regulator